MEQGREARGHLLAGVRGTVWYVSPSRDRMSQQVAWRVYKVCLSED